MHISSFSVYIPYHRTRARLYVLLSTLLYFVVQLLSFLLGLLLLLRYMLFSCLYLIGIFA